MVHGCRTTFVPVLVLAVGLLVPSRASAQEAAPAPLVPTRVIHAVTFTEPALSDLPGSRNIWGLIETADPFVTAAFIDNGGLYLGEPNLIGSFGSSWTQTTYTMDGLDITDPDRTGTPLAYPDPHALSRLQVSSLFPAPDGTGPATRVTMTSKAPAQTWGGWVEWSQLPERLQAKGPGNLPTVAAFGSAHDADALVSGPVASRLGLLLTARSAASSRRERGTDPLLDSRLGSVFAHATALMSGADHLRVVASVDGAKHPFAGRARYADRNVLSRDTFYNVHTIWEHAGNGRATWSAAVGTARAAIGAPDVTTTKSVGTIERLVDGPVLEVALPSGGTRQRTSAAIRFDQVGLGSSLARHGFSGGVSISRNSSTVDSTAPALIGELVDGLPARAWDYSWGGSSIERSGTEAAAWLTGRISLASRLSIEGGARAERASASSTTNPTSISWHSIEPRAHLRWNITGGEGVVFHAGYLRQQLRLPLNYLAYGDTAELAGKVYRWTDGNKDGLLEPNELGALIATTGPGARDFHPSRIDPSLAPPIGDDFEVGFEARLSKQWRMRLTATQRHQRGLVAPVNVGVSSSDYAVITMPDRGNDYFNPEDDRTIDIYNRLPASFGKDADLLTNPVERDRAYQAGVALSIEHLFDGRWYTSFGFTASRSDALAGNPGFRANENDSGVLGELFENPNARTYAAGRQFTERGYQAKWVGGFVTSFGTHLGVVARYQDGQHFSRVVIVPNLNQGPEAVQAYTRGHSRFTYTPSLDARFSQAFSVMGRAVSFVLEGYNLLNQGIEVEEDPTVTVFFRRFVVQQPPRAFRVGFRVAF